MRRPPSRLHELIHRMQMKRPRLIVINADDVGLHPAIDHAVAQLGEMRVVSSASILALHTPHRDALQSMMRNGLDLGLHLDFTSVAANERYSTSRTVASLIADSWRGRLNTSHTRAIVRDQLDRFGSITGHAPRFIDGHEHVHQLPGIRQALFSVLAERQLHTPLYIRNTAPQRWRGIKAATIALLGAQALRHQARQADYRCNADFFGVYDLSSSVNLSALWRRWLASVPERGALAMCHPAWSAEMEDKQSIPFRLREFEFLSGQEFGEMLALQRVTVAGWRAVVGF
jgi:predicted glycoside hydrolase/deacetylase ChbG (UPF0249 family)